MNDKLDEISGRVTPLLEQTNDIGEGKLINIHCSGMLNLFDLNINT